MVMVPTKEEEEELKKVFTALHKLSILSSFRSKPFWKEVLKQVRMDEFWEEEETKRKKPPNQVVNEQEIPNYDAFKFRELDQQWLNVLTIQEKLDILAQKAL